MELTASTQYNDYKGTAAADGHDWASLKNYLAKKGVDERYIPIGVDFYSGEGGFIYIRFICKDKEVDEKRLVIYYRV